ncbi:VOC family protein [Bradyrhizobium monzae]|uniref:VOC family protein n=1 Tax=Bradyrhizobium sp. Oc8 TaxID=2876780 RepID=UPI001F27E0D0|nr:VOC family protein [Bradyrhizobium sp. Oc8]
MLFLDHITVAAKNLAEGVAYVEQALGVPMSGGGAHPLMATHNTFLRLGEALFLEVIAPDPAATTGRPRWFALDDPRTRDELARSPKLMVWVARTSDIAASLAAMPDAARPAITVTRGELAWLISVPPDGSMPFDGAFPTLIQWPQGVHPASRLPDLGCSLVELEVMHPEASAIQSSLKEYLDDPRIRFRTATTPSLKVLIRTPSGDRMLT